MSNHCPPSWRHQQANTENHNLLMHKPQCEPAVSRNIWTIIDESLEVRRGQVWEVETPRMSVIKGPRLSWMVSLEAARISGWILKINPLCFPQGEGENLFWNTPQHSVLLHKTFPQEKLFHQSLNCWSFIRI